MNKFVLALGFVFSVNAFALDLSNDIVASPVDDAYQATLEISERGALRLTPVTCTQTGGAQDLIVKCSTKRKFVYPDNETLPESFGCWFEYSQNANGTFTRNVWECPIL
jgi:hypothetical protein